MTVKHLDSPQTVSKFGAFIRLYTYPCTDTAVIDLFNACERGDLGQVTALVTNGVDVNARVFRYARKPIHVATEKGHAHIVKFLLAQGADKDVRNFDDSSALILAAQNGGADVIRALIEADANVKYTNKFKDTALHIVCNTGRLQPIIERLVEHGADLNQSDARDLPLHIVSRRGYVNSVEWMLQHGVCVDVKNNAGRTALHAACARGQAAVVNVLVDNGADVTMVTEDDGTSPYILACQYGNVKVVEKLLETGLVDVNEKDKKGENTLYTAYKSRNNDLVKLLYREHQVPVDGQFSPIHLAALLEEEDSMGAFLPDDFKAKDHNEKTALHVSAEKGNINIVRHCLAMDADPNALDKDGNTPLYLSLKNEKNEVSNELLSRDDAILDMRNKSDDSALDIVCSNGNMDFLEIILDKLTVKFGSVPSELFSSAVRQACSSGHVMALRTLLRAGAVIEPEQEMDMILSAAENGHTDVIKVLSLNGLRVNITDDGMNTPIHKACYCSDESFLVSLIEHDVDINAKNSDGKTVLHLATAHGQAHSVTALLKLGANVNEKDDVGKTSLHVACANGRQQVFTVLLQHGADVTARDVSGAQPLHYAAESGNLTIIRTLLRNGADVQSVDGKLRTPLQYCAMKGFIYAACALIEHGAELNSQDDHGRTVLHVICERLFESPYVRRYVKFTDVPCDRTYVELLEILLQAGCDASIRDQDQCLPISVILRRLSGLPESGGSSSRVLFADEVSNALFALLLDAHYPKKDLNDEMLSKLFSRVGKPVMLLLMRAGCTSEIIPHSGLLSRITKTNDLRSLRELRELGYQISEAHVREVTAGRDNSDELVKEVVRMNKDVLRLKDLCRLNVRSLLRSRPGRMTAMVEHLPIPLQLKDYVVMHYL